MLDYFKDAEKIMVAAAYATRSPKSAVDIKLNDKMIRDMIKWTKKYKLSSVLDFPYYIFTIEDVSRVFTHQWVRYRHASHMQQSMRYVKIKSDTADWFIIPPSILSRGASAIVQYIRANLEAGRAYLDLLSRGIPPEDARFVLPHSAKTHISSAFDAEEMIHITYQRTCFEAQWEIRIVAYTILLAGLIVHPYIFEGVGSPCIYEGVCRSAKNWKCFNDARKIVNELVNIKNKYIDEFNSLKTGDFLKIDLTSVLGYKVEEDVKREVESELGFPVNLDLEVILMIRKK